MQIWYDKTGKPWTVELDVAAMLRIRDCAGLDLVVDYGQQRLLIATSDDIAGAVLYWACYPQAEKRDIDPDAWGHLFDETTLGKAKETLLAEIADFFPCSLLPSLQFENAKLLAA